MPLPRFLPHLAIASIVTSGATLAIAIMRTPSSTAASPAPDAVEAPIAVEATPPTVKAAATPNIPGADAPKIRGAKLEARTGRSHPELALEVALGIPDGVAANERLAVTARCAASKGWSDARTSISLGKLGAGERIVKQTMYLRGGELPSTCHLVFARDRTAIAHMCWTGGTVVDKPCDPVAHESPLDVAAVRVTAKAQRRGAEHDLAIELDLAPKGTIDGTLELSASCVVANGAPQVDRTRVYVSSRDTAATTRKARLFSRPKLPGAPQRCTLTLEIADRTGAIREPVATKCWRDNAVTDGACT